MIFVVHVVPPDGPAFEATVDEDNNVMRSAVPSHPDPRGTYANALVNALPGTSVPVLSTAPRIRPRRGVLSTRPGKKPKENWVQA